MSIATVVTRGYGSFGTIGEIVTRGYNIGAIVLIAIQPPPERTVSMNAENRSILINEEDRSILASSEDRSISYE